MLPGNSSSSSSWLLGVQPVPPQKTAICIRGSHKCRWKCSYMSNLRSYWGVSVWGSVCTVPIFISNNTFSWWGLSNLHAKKPTYSMLVFLMNNPEFNPEWNAGWLHQLGLPRQYAKIQLTYIAQHNVTRLPVYLTTDLIYLMLESVDNFA